MKANEPEVQYSDSRKSRVTRIRGRKHDPDSISATRTAATLLLALLLLLRSCSPPPPLPAFTFTSAFLPFAHSVTNSLPHSLTLTLTLSTLFSPPFCHYSLSHPSNDHPLPTRETDRLQLQLQLRSHTRSWSASLRRLTLLKSTSVFSSASSSNIRSTRPEKSARRPSTGLCLTAAAAAAANAANAADGRAGTTGGEQNGERVNGR